MNQSPLDRYTEITRTALLENEPFDVDVLDQLQRDLEHELFGFPPEYDQAKRDDPRFKALLDLLRVLGQLEGDESAHPWKRAGVLAAVGYHSEAGRDYLGASKRFAAEALDGSGVAGDEHDWAQTALARAAEELAISGQLLSAAYVATTLPPEERSRTAALIESRLD